jgi:hypothetical protein
VFLDDPRFIDCAIGHAPVFAGHQVAPVPEIDKAINFLATNIVPQQKRPYGIRALLVLLVVHRTVPDVAGHDVPLVLRVFDVDELGNDALPGVRRGNDRTQAYYRLHSSQGAVQELIVSASYGSLYLFILRSAP